MRLVEMIEEYMDREIKGDLDLHSDEYGVDISIFWASPTINLSWYPIIQVDDDDGNVILHREGPENPGRWLLWMLDTLKNYHDGDDWWYVY